MRRGFILLFVLFICFVSSTIILSFWRNTSLSLDVFVEREKNYKNLYLAEFILNYTVILVKNHFDLFKDSLKEKELVFDLSNLLNGSYFYNTKVVIKNVEKGIKISSFLYNGNDCLQGLFCVLSKKNNSYQIEQFNKTPRNSPPIIYLI